MKEDTTRQKLDGSPLRHSEKVIPLPMTDSSLATEDGMNAYIYEAQLSVMVTGIDDWVWAAYCFVDVYFNVAGHKERVHHYSNPRIKLDPHSFGKHPADPPMWNPRGYFLRALQARMHQVRDEWVNSVEELKQRIDPYVRLYNPPFNT
jgi:hypothetical protein